MNISGDAYDMESVSLRFDGTKDLAQNKKEI